MSITTIRSGITTVGDYYRTPETIDRAVSLVHDLTSSERDVILQIIKESIPSLPLKDTLQKKLFSIHNEDALFSKDADLSPFMQVLVNIWRTIKDIFGYRISDKKLLKKIADYSDRADIVSDARADISMILFTNSDNLVELLGILKNTPEYESEIIPVDEYQILDLTYSGTSFSVDELESAYRTVLKNHRKDPVRLMMAKKAFQQAHAFETAKINLLNDQSRPVILKEIVMDFRKLSNYQKNMLKFLTKFQLNKS